MNVQNFLVKGSGLIFSLWASSLTPSFALANDPSVFVFRYKSEVLRTNYNDGGSISYCPEPSGGYRAASLSRTPEGCRYESPQVNIGPPFYQVASDVPSLNAWCARVMAGSSRILDEPGAAGSRVGLYTSAWMSTTGSATAAQAVTCDVRTVAGNTCQHGIDHATGECWAAPPPTAIDCSEIQKPSGMFSWTNVSTVPDGCEFTVPVIPSLASGAIAAHTLTQEKFCQSVMEPYGVGRSFNASSSDVNEIRPFFSALHDSYQMSASTIGWTSSISCTISPSPCAEGEVERGGVCVKMPVDCMGLLGTSAGFTWSGNPVATSETCRFETPVYPSLSTHSISPDDRTADEFCKAVMGPLGGGHSIDVASGPARQQRAYYAPSRGSFVLTEASVPWASSIQCKQGRSACAAGYVDRDGVCVKLPSDTCFSWRLEDPGMDGGLDIGEAPYDTCTVSFPKILPSAGGNNDAIAYDLYTGWQFCRRAFGNGNQFTIVDPAYDVIEHWHKLPRNYLEYGITEPDVTPHNDGGTASLQCRAENTAPDVTTKIPMSAVGWLWWFDKHKREAGDWSWYSYPNGSSH